MALHEQSIGATDEWYTPRHVFEAMGVRFDLDVAEPRYGQWPAREFCTCGIAASSLETIWFGFVWMNAPFGKRNGLAPWLEKFFAHGNGVALTPDRTSAPWWQDYAPKADAILFVRHKIKFIGSDGRPGTSPAQGTTLLAAGPRGVDALRNAVTAGLGLLMTAPQSPPRSGVRSNGEGGEA